MLWLTILKLFAYLLSKSNMKQIIIDLTMDPLKRNEKQAKQNSEDIHTEFQNISIV